MILVEEYDSDIRIYKYPTPIFDGIGIEIDGEKAEYRSDIYTGYELLDICEDLLDDRDRLLSFLDARCNRRDM